MSLKSVKIDYAAYTVDLLNRCIHCGQLMEPTVISEKLISYEKRLILTLRCTNSDCQKFMVQEFKTDNSGSTDAMIYSYSPDIDEVPEIIKKHYPDFYAAYDEARQAEHAGLKLAAGPAYRLSLERLLTGYAKHLHPDDADKISGQRIGALISEYFSADKNPLKSLFTAASWLGNDQGHVQQKHPDKGIPELKEYLQAAQFIIAGQLHSELAKQFIEGDN